MKRLSASTASPVRAAPAVNRTESRTEAAPRAAARFQPARSARDRYTWQRDDAECPLAAVPFPLRAGCATTLALLEYKTDSRQDGQLALQGTLRVNGETRRLQAHGNGLLSAAASGLSALLKQAFVIKDYHEHTLGERSDSRSVAYIRCIFPNGDSRGVGIDNDVARASLQALCHAVGADALPADGSNRWGDAHHPTKHRAESAMAA